AIVSVIRSMGHIAFRTIRRSEAPCVGAVARIVFGIGDAIGTIDQSEVPIVFEVGRAVAVVQAVRVESEVRVVGEKQWSAGPDSNLELDPIISVTIAIVIAVERAGPPSAIVNRGL